MPSERLIRRLQRGYSLLLRFYSESFRERFGEGMAQTFDDVLRERAAHGKGILAFALWMFVETIGGIIRVNTRYVLMQDTTRRLGIWAVVVLLLLMVPLVGMQFSDEVNWDLFDFILMGSALFSVGVAFEFVARRSHTTMYRIALGVGLVGAFLLFWVNGAVGIIGNEGQPANLLYWGVFAVGVVGALLSRFQSRGMARTMFAVAGIQFFVPVVALMIWPDVSWGGAGIVGVYMMNSFFAMIFMTSGGLFLRAHKVLPPLRPTT